MQILGWVLFLAGALALGWSYVEPPVGPLAVPVMLAGAVLAAGGAIAAKLATVPHREIRQLVPAGPLSACALDATLKSFAEAETAVIDCSETERRVLNATVRKLTEGTYSWECLPQAMQRRWLNTLQNYPGCTRLNPRDEAQIDEFVTYATGR